jgi:chromate transporter
MIFLKLFWSFFQVGLFSIGGGYASLRLIQQQIVEINGWLQMSEFSDVVTISQMTPGPVAINAATFVGIRVAGLGGALAATFGCICPSCVILLSVAHFYYKYKSLRLVRGVLDGLRPAVVALIASAGLSILVLSLWNGGAVTWDIGKIDYAAAALFAAGLIVLRKWKINPIYVMLGAGILGLIIYSVGGGT